MTLTELSYIVALAQEQHFGRAAERCHAALAKIYRADIVSAGVLPMMLRRCNRCDTPGSAHLESPTSIARAGGRRFAPRHAIL